MPNAKVLEQKKQAVVELSERLKNSVCGILIDYRGINVLQDNQFRSEMRKNDVSYQVTKNTLLQFAVKDTELDCLSQYLEGPTSLATHESDVVVPTKVVMKFIEENNVMQVKGGFIEGKVVSVEMIKRLSKLPSKEQLVSNMLNNLNGPISGFVRVLTGNTGKLVCVLSEIAKKKCT